MTSNKNSDTLKKTTFGKIMATIYNYFYLGDQNLYSNDLNLSPPILLTFSMVQNSAKDVVKAHMHAHLEVFYFKSGQGFLEIDHQKIPLNAHDLLIVDSRHLHAQYSESNLSPLLYYCFAIDNLHLQGYSPNSITQKGFHLHSFKNKNNQIYKNIFKMLDEFNHKEYNYHSKIHAIFLEILIDTLRIVPHKPNPLDENEKINANRLFLVKTKQYIDEHYNENINIDDLLKQSFMTKSYFITQFKKLFNISPMQYLTLVRLEQAKLLLSKTTDTITDIALKVGFNNPVYFAEVFSKTVGVAPTVYRKTSTNSKK